MIRHTKINNNTKISIGDEVLYKGSWKTVTKIYTKHKNKTDNYLVLDDNLIAALIDFEASWSISSFKDFSDSDREYSILLTNTAKSAINQPIVLFDEKKIIPTDINIEYMIRIANHIKDFMNKEQIFFEEEEERCR